MFTPNYRRDPILRFAGVELKSNSDIEKYPLIEGVIRRGISLIYKSYICYIC